MTNVVLAALPATAPVSPTPNLDLLPAGLTELDTTRISAALAAARTEATCRLYALVWGQWERWCAGRGSDALPDDPLALCAYLTERAEALQREYSARGQGRTAASLGVSVDPLVPNRLRIALFGRSQIARIGAATSALQASGARKATSTCARQRSSAGADVAVGPLAIGRRHSAALGV